MQEAIVNSSKPDGLELKLSPAPQKRDEDPDELEVQALVPPKDLEGYNLIWRMATESTSKQVIDSAAKLLIQMHNDVQEELKTLIPSFDDMFVEQCFQIIESQIPAIQRRSEQETSELDLAVGRLPPSATTI